MLHVNNGCSRLALTSLIDVNSLKLVGTLSLVLGVVTDVFTAASLCFFLRNLRTGYKKSVSHASHLAALRSS